MKRSWFGLILLLVLLIAGLLTAAVMERLHEQLALELMQSSRCALLGDWEDAELFLFRAKRHWKQWACFRSGLVSHEALEDMDAALAMLETFRQGKNTAGYRAVCAELLSRVEALQQLHRLSWENFL